MAEEENKRIILTGGHAATTAVAVVEELIREGLEKTIYWIGSAKAIEGKKTKSLESLVLPKLGVKAYAIVAGRFQRRFTKYTLPSLFKIPVGFIQALALVGKIKPKVILSFGGFSALPVVFAAKFWGVPVIIHEQTAAAGLANRLSAPFANKILLARQESQKYFPTYKSEIVGNPVMTQIREILPKENHHFLPTLFITLGSRSSEIINKVVKEAIVELTRNFKIIHLAGEKDFAVLKQFASPYYEVYPWVDPLKIDNLYREADLVLARAGANTVAEIMMVKRPSLLVPIPWSYLNEQEKNAQLAQKYGIAKIIDQKNLTPAKLILALNDLKKESQAMIEKVRKKESLDKESAKRVVAVIKNFLT